LQFGSRSPILFNVYYDSQTRFRADKTYLVERAKGVNNILRKSCTGDKMPDRV
jgi:hypothetical protein